MSAIELHRRQWLISRAGPAPQGFASRSLPGGLVLHHHPALNVRKVESAAGSSLWIGEVWGTPDGPTKAHLHSGRFVVIDYPWLSLDATGALGVFYFTQSHPNDVVCSSSAALVRELTGLPLAVRQLAAGHGMNWEPPPRGGIARLRALYCDQALNLETGEVRVIPRSLSPEVTQREAAAALANELTAIIKAIAATKRPLFLPLTSGKDSRTLLAALKAADATFETFTNLYGPDTPSALDVKIAAQLSARMHLKHRVIKAMPDDTEAASIFDRHSARRTADANRRNVAGNYYRSFPPDAVILRGGVFEVGRRFYGGQFASVDFGSASKAADGIAASFRENDPRAIAALRAWYGYRKLNPIARMDFVDLFYLDQRRGGWGASNLQSEDALLPTIAVPANSWRVIQSMLAVPNRLQSTAVVELQAMELMCPGLSRAMPINPRPLYRRVLRRLMRSRPMKSFVRSLPR